MNRWLDRMLPHFIFCITTIIVLFGLVMVYSSSAFESYRDKKVQSEWSKSIETATRLVTEGNPGHISSADPASMFRDLFDKEQERRADMLSTFIKQCFWVFVGFMLMAITTLVDYPFWGKKVFHIIAMMLLLQSLLFVLPTVKKDSGKGSWQAASEPDSGSVRSSYPIYAVESNGSRSWIRIGSNSIQPSEYVKIGLVIYTAWFLARKVGANKTGILSLATGVPLYLLSVGMILSESDKGVAVHILLTLLLVWFVVVGRFSYVLGFGIAAAVGVGFLVFHNPEALGRIQSFLGEDSDQMKTVKEAFSRGGWFGAGLGNGDAAFTPRLFGAHTDFIFSVIGEELGLIFSGLLVFGYFLWTFMGLRVAASCNDPFGIFLALGITLLIGSQAFLNIAIATGLAPTTGFTLPLLSYGGSSLVCTMISTGILINISLSNQNRLLHGKGRGKTDTFGHGGHAL